MVKMAVIVNISIVDDKGREVPNANNMVYFKLIGDAKIIGVGNGDPSSHEPDKCSDGAWQRSAFQRKMSSDYSSWKNSWRYKIGSKIKRIAFNCSGSLIQLNNLK